MKMERRIVVMEMGALRLENSGVRKGKAARHLLIARLIWPRSMIAERKAVKPVEILDGESHLAEAPWVDRILFKETMQGPYGLEVAVTEAIDDDVLAKAFGQLAKGTLRALTGVVADAASGFGEDMVKLPLQMASTLLSDALGGEPSLLAQGAIDLEAPGGPARRRVVDIPLTVPRTLYRPARAVGAQGKSHKRRRKWLSQGDANGMLRVALDLLDG